MGSNSSLVMCENEAFAKRRSHFSRFVRMPQRISLTGLVKVRGIRSDLKSVSKSMICLMFKKRKEPHVTHEAPSYDLYMFSVLALAGFRFAKLCFRKFLVELIYPACSIHKFHFAGEEWMRFVRNLQFHQWILIAIFPFDGVP